MAFESGRDPWWTYVLFGACVISALVALVAQSEVWNMVFACVVGISSLLAALFAPTPRVRDVPGLTGVEIKFPEPAWRFGLAFAGLAAAVILAVASAVA